MPITNRKSEKRKIAFVSATAPAIPEPPKDTTRPEFGQRKRPKRRRRVLIPLPTVSQ